MTAPHHPRPTAHADLGADDEALYRFTAEAQVEQAMSRRARRHWLREQLHESASLRGILVGHAEQRSVVTLTCAGDHRCTGRIDTVGADFVAIGDDSGFGPTVLISLRAVRTATSRAGRAAGDQASVLDQTLREVLFDRTADRPRVVLRISDMDEPVRGDLKSVGADVLALDTATDTDSAGGAQLHVQLAAVESVAFS